jgi:hypothetical protein
MNKEFIPYEQALALKELGFDEPCLAYYDYYSKSVPLEIYGSDDGCGQPAPLYQQAFRWFREKYGYLPNIHNFNGNFKATLSGNCNWLGSWTQTYEEAELACLIKLIEIVN